MRNCVRAGIIHSDWQARAVVGIFHNFWHSVFFLSPRRIKIRETTVLKNNVAIALHSLAGDQT